MLEATISEKEAQQTKPKTDGTLDPWTYVFSLLFVRRSWVSTLCGFRL